MQDKKETKVARPTKKALIKDIIDREFTHASPEVRRANVELLRSAAIFFGSVVFMRAFGELMAI